MENNHNTRFTDVSSIVPPANLEELIKHLREIFEDDEINVEYVKAVMNSYKSCAADWNKFSQFDPHKYTRNLVDEGNGKYNLILLCWGEGQGSSIHDHADAHCFMKVLEGDITETQFEWPKAKGSEMVQKGKNVYKVNETAYICDEIGLHRVENACHTDKAVSLHLYSPPFQECKTFDQKSGKQRKIRVSFWSKFGERTPITMSK